MRTAAKKSEIVMFLLPIPHFLKKSKSRRRTPHVDCVEVRPDIRSSPHFTSDRSAVHDG